MSYSQTGLERSMMNGDNRMWKDDHNEASNDFSSNNLFTRKCSKRITQNHIKSNTFITRSSKKHKWNEQSNNPSSFDEGLTAPSFSFNYARMLAQSIMQLIWSKAKSVIGENTRRFKSIWIQHNDSINVNC